MRDDGHLPLNNAVGGVWEQLKTIDKMNDELGGDLGRMSCCTMSSVGKTFRGPGS
jgi:hypothetical protein